MVLAPEAVGVLVSVLVGEEVAVDEDGVDGSLNITT